MVGEGGIEYKNGGIKWYINYSPRTLMLIGEYTHTCDPKNRVSLPSKFRKELGKKVIVTRGLDQCLFVHSPKTWSQFLLKMGDPSLGRAESRAFNRFILAGATEVDVDSAGRILLPTHLKEFARITEKVVVAGLHRRVEIWDAALWSSYTKNIESDADALAERLGELGML